MFIEIEKRARREIGKRPAAPRASFTPLPGGEPPADGAPLPAPPRPLRKRPPERSKSWPRSRRRARRWRCSRSGRTAELAARGVHEVARQYRELYAEYRGHRRSAGLPELRRPRRRPAAEAPRVASEPAPFAAPSAARRRAAAESRSCARSSSHQHSLRRVLEAESREGASERRRVVSGASRRLRRVARDPGFDERRGGRRRGPHVGAPRRRPAPPQPALFASTTAAPPLQWRDAPPSAPRAQCSIEQSQFRKCTRVRAHD